MYQGTRYDAENRTGQCLVCACSNASTSTTTNGTAYENAYGDKAWYVNGKRHRLDGPAFENASGYKAWFVDGKLLSEEAFNALSEPLELTLEDIAAKFGVDVNKIKIVK